MKEKIHTTSNLTNTFDQSIQINDIAKILNVLPDFVINCIPNFSEYDLNYRTLPQNEKNDVIKMIHDTLKRENLTVSNADALPRWERGWKEILDTVKQNELHEKFLIPLASLLVLSAGNNGTKWAGRTISQAIFQIGVLPKSQRIV